VKGEPVGTLWAIKHTPEARFDAEDARILQSLARFAAAAFQMTSALDGATAERSPLRTSEERKAFLLELSDVLRAQPGAAAMIQAAASLLGERLKASRIMFAEFDEERGVADVFFGWFADGAASFPTSMSLEEYKGSIVDDLLAGRTVRIDDVGPPFATPDLAAIAELGVKALLSVPLLADGRMVVNLSVHQSTARQWTDHDVELATEVMERLWASLVRLRAETALRESEERFRLIVENARDYAIFTLDKDGYIANWFAGAEQVFGWSPEDVQGQAVNITFTAEDRAAGVPAKEQEIARHDGNAPNIRWHVCKDGSRVFIEGTTNAIRDPDGRLRGYLKIGQDVTERRAAEQALRESEERFRQFSEASSDIIWIRNAETMAYEYVSPAFDTIYCRPRMEVGDELERGADTIHPDDRDRVLANLIRVRDGERIVHTFRILRPDGEVRWIEDVEFPLRDAAGRITRIGGIGHDATVGKEAADALEESERRLRTLMEGIPQLVWRSGDEGRWTWSSPQWQDCTGQTQEESHRLGWLDALHPDDRETAMRAWEAARLHGILDVEFRVRRARDGAYLWHHTRSVPVRDEQGRVVEWLGTTTDVHLLREMQERQNVLVAELQHRTRNIMAVVRSMADKTARNSTGLTDFRGRFRERLEALSRVQGLLSRLNEHDRVTFDELIETELAAMADGAGRVRLEGPRGVRLRSSMVQTLAMALHELATNAVKYGALGQASGQLAVTWRLAQDEGADRPRLYIDWRETGVKMPPSGSKPSGGGQGRELIEKALPYQLSAKTSYELGPDGVHCTISIPVSTISPQGTAHA
jgi:PAS domain S-box-containing protein